MHNKIKLKNINDFCSSIFYDRYHEIGLSYNPTIISNNDERLEFLREAIKNVPTFRVKFEKSNNPKSILSELIFIFNELLKDPISEEEFLRDYVITDNKEILSKTDIILLYRAYTIELAIRNTVDLEHIPFILHNFFMNNTKLLKLYRSHYDCTNFNNDGLTVVQSNFLKYFMNE